MDNETKEFVTKESEAEDLREFLRKVGVEEKGIDNFFLEIIREDDTTKVGNLTKEELGIPMLPVRTLKELEYDSRLIPSMSAFVNYFKAQSENILATSLSRDGFLIKARITQKKELIDKDKRKERTKGLFGKKGEEEQ